jgi:hypothetical protein
MNIVKDILLNNKEAFKKSIYGLKSNPALLVIGIPYIAVMYMFMIIASNLSFFGGIIIFAGQAAVISSYLYIIENVLMYNSFSMSDFKDGFRVYFRKAYGILFILWIIRYGINLFIVPILSLIPFFGMLLNIVMFIAAIILNPLPESIYQKHYDEWHTITYTVEFFKENWLDWIIPNAIIAIAVYFASLGIQTIFYNIFGSIITMGAMGTSIYTALYVVVFSIIIQALMGFSMLFRGYQYGILSNTTRRQRNYRRNLS